MGCRVGKSLHRPGRGVAGSGRSRCGRRPRASALVMITVGMRLVKLLPSARGRHRLGLCSRDSPAAPGPSAHPPSTPARPVPGRAIPSRPTRGEEPVPFARQFDPLLFGLPLLREVVQERAEFRKLLGEMVRNRVLLADAAGALRLRTEPLVNRGEELLAAMRAISNWPWRCRRRAPRGYPLCGGLSNWFNRYSTPPCDTARPR